MNKKIVKIAIGGAVAAVVINYFVNPTVNKL